MKTVINAAAAYERALIRARTRAALQAKRARGYRAGEVPFGFVADEAGRLAPCEQELQVIEYVRRLRGEGHSLRSIVQACSALGYASRSGKPFALTQVARLARKTIEVTSAGAEPLVGSARN
jgi:DNA invertase Pin-like site-specific DNA recombinase